MADWIQEQFREGTNRPNEFEGWPDLGNYRNKERNRKYEAHHKQEWEWVNDREKRYLAALGGEGGGKTVAGIVRDLEKIGKGCSGIMVSPDMPHFKRSLWPEFRRWCPWEGVVDSQRHRESVEWEPTGPFSLVFKTGAVVLCGGIENPFSWEGPNMNWAHLDEPRKIPDAQALKVLDGRIRMLGPHGEIPQLWLTTTPRMNWLYQYFGPIKPNDPFLAFKRDSRTIVLLTIDNEKAGNLQPGYTSKRAQSLTGKEARVLLEAAWEDLDEEDRFLPSMALWDACFDPDLPPLTKNEPIILALDAGVTMSNWGILGVTRHPKIHDDPAIRLVAKWVQPSDGSKIDFVGTPDFPGPLLFLRKMIDALDVVQVTYDPTELHQATMEMKKEGIAWLKEFPQTSQRLEADRAFYDLILQRRVHHTGDPDLRQHIENANRKLDVEGKRLRIVRRTDSLPIDLAVCASMGIYQCLRLNL